MVAAGDLAFWRDRLEGSSRHGLFLLLAQVMLICLYGMPVVGANSSWGCPTVFVSDVVSFSTQKVTRSAHTAHLSQDMDCQVVQGPSGGARRNWNRSMNPQGLLQGPSRFALDVLGFVKREERRLTGRRSRRRQLTATEKIEERVRARF